MALQLSTMISAEAILWLPVLSMTSWNRGSKSTKLNRSHYSWNHLWDGLGTFAVGSVTGLHPLSPWENYVFTARILVLGQLMICLILCYAGMPAAEKQEKAFLWQWTLWRILSLQEEERKMYHWCVGLHFKEVNIKCKNRGSLNEMIQQDSCYWYQQLWLWHDQCSLIGTWLSWIKSFWSKDKEWRIFLLHIFLVCRVFFWWWWMTRNLKSLCPCPYGLSRKNADWGLGRLLKVQMLGSESRAF